MASTAHKNPEDLVEIEEPQELLEKKAFELAQWIKNSKHCIFFTGAGVSTSAGIPDFRGPEGVWTLQAQGRSRTGKTTSSLQAVPTPSHMSIVKLQEAGICKYLVSQNTDGLHRKSGIEADMMSELHGNTNLEICSKCGKEYFRDFRTRTNPHVHEHETGRKCSVSGCGGNLKDTIINFGENLPEKALTLGFDHAEMADLCIVLGSSLTVTPAADIPKRVAKHGKKLVICNLQRTPLDSVCAMRVHAKTDRLMKLVFKNLGLEIPPFILKRRFKFNSGIVHSTERGELMKISMTGVDREGVPYSIFHNIDVKYDKQQQTANKEPFKFYFPSVANVSQVQLTLRFMGHYNEPALNLDVQLSPAKTDKLYALEYNPSTGEWKSQVISETNTEKDTGGKESKQEATSVD